MAKKNTPAGKSPAKPATKPESQPDPAPVHHHARHSVNPDRQLSAVDKVIQNMGKK